MKNVGAVYTAPAGTLRRNAPNTRNVRCLSRTLPENPGADQSPNFSSAFLSPRTFGRFYTGTIVGEETGGMSVAFGSKYIFQLPNTGLLYGVSSRKLYEIGATDEDIHGTLPDCEVPADEALDYTLKLIRQGGRR